MRRLAVLLTCHNRRASTMTCLDRVAAQKDHDLDIEVVVCDAGSTDGTADSIRQAYPAAQILHESSDVFWNGGMRRAWEHARRNLRPDFVLWLNDDTMLDPDALARVVSTYDLLHERSPAETIVVGATRDPESGALSYGGVRRPDRRRPLHYELAPVSVEPILVETMNGNVVLVPDALADKVGLLDAAFTHGMGDYDYGHRVTLCGAEVWVAPGTVGTCPRNPPPREATSIREALQHLKGPKGLPFTEWMLFAQRWGGPLWPLYGLSPYARRIVRAARASDR